MFESDEEDKVDESQTVKKGKPTKNAKNKATIPLKAGGIFITNDLVPLP